jgi:predicted transcriptional regulator
LERIGHSELLSIYSLPSATLYNFLVSQRCQAAKKSNFFHFKRKVNKAQQILCALLAEGRLMRLCEKNKKIINGQGINVLSYCAPLEHANILIQYFY